MVHFPYNPKESDIRLLPIEQLIRCLLHHGVIVRKMDPRPIYFGFWCLMTNTTKLD